MTYWILAIVLVVVGVLGAFTIGLPILVVGVTMLALGPLRSRELVFWPVLLGVLGAVATFMAVAPYSCSATLSVGEGSAPTNAVCSSLLGIQYAGNGVNGPSLEPFLLGALIVGVVVGLVTFVAISRRARTQRQPST
jgi:hypothetical protein